MCAADKDSSDSENVDSVEDYNVIDDKVFFDIVKVDQRAAKCEKGRGR